MLVPQQPTPVEVDVASDAEGVTLASAGLRLRAQRRPWQLAAYDHEGHEFFRQQRLDRAMIGFVGVPTGYSSDDGGRIRPGTPDLF